MLLDELEETLNEMLGSNLKIIKDKSGQIVIRTGMTVDEDGELVDIEEDYDEEFDEDMELIEDMELEE